MNKLKPEVKKKWIEALRSGKYEQGKGFLGYKDGDRENYCCLGVLAHELGGVTNSFVLVMRQGDSPTRFWMQHSRKLIVMP